jgi:hypothetical protein
MRTIWYYILGLAACVYLIFNKEEARQLDYDRGCGEIEDER